MKLVCLVCDGESQLLLVGLPGGEAACRQRSARPREREKHHLTLGLGEGVRIKDLLHEGHKH